MKGSVLKKKEYLSYLPFVAKNYFPQASFSKLSTWVRGSTVLSSSFPFFSWSTREPPPCLSPRKTQWQQHMMLNTRGFPHGSAGKESTCNAGDLGSIPGLGRSPGEGKVTQSCILAWRIPRTIQPMGSQSVGHDWGTFTFTSLGNKPPVGSVCPSILLLSCSTSPSMWNPSSD